MRAALISLAGQPLTTTGAPIIIAGKTVAERQIEFAQGAGCDRVILVGEGASRDGIALSHAAEAAGLPVQAIAGLRGLLGSVSATDELLVLAPGLLPDSLAALEGLAGTPAVLVLPATAAGEGFERIDLEQAWAGALVVPGRLVEHLAELAPDADAAPALLRIALQAKLPERRLPEDCVSEGTWAFALPEHAERLERAWLERHLPRRSQDGPSTRLAAGLVRIFRRSILPHAGLPRLGLVAAGLILAAGLLAAVAGWVGAGLAAVAFGALTVAAAGQLARLRKSAFAAEGDGGDAAWRLVAHLTIAACAVAGIEGEWLHRLFPPLVLLGVLHGVPASQRWHAYKWLADPVILALLLSVAATVSRLEAATMAVALAFLALGIAQLRGSKRITPV